MGLPPDVFVPSMQVPYGYRPRAVSRRPAADALERPPSGVAYFRAAGPTWTRCRVPPRGARFAHGAHSCVAWRPTEDAMSTRLVRWLGLLGLMVVVLTPVGGCAQQRDPINR